MLQLPLAANFAREIYFLGYDGRASGDTGFWRSDNEYNYVEELERLRAAYPAFFSYYLESSSDKNSYVKKVHGQALDNNMERAERNGYVLYSLASSHTNTFQKRYERYLTAKCHV
ncbi:MAG: hypothetical protein HYV63_06715 [Candidatus Schekmanbacteria bacterium]|nr:hypothetical protein [Candidatus Schekmanbacteria bacterium]